jgi:hypothetical protein
LFNVILFFFFENGTLNTFVFSGFAHTRNGGDEGALAGAAVGAAVGLIVGTAVGDAVGA